MSHAIPHRFVPFTPAKAKSPLSLLRGMTAAKPAKQAPVTCQVCLVVSDKYDRLKWVKCTDCNLMYHVECASRCPPTCGLPAGLAQQLHDMQLSQPSSIQSS